MDRRQFGKLTMAGVAGLAISSRFPSISASAAGAYTFEDPFDSTATILQNPPGFSYQGVTNSPPAANRPAGPSRLRNGFLLPDSSATSGPIKVYVVVQNYAEDHGVPFPGVTLAGGALEVCEPPDVCEKQATLLSVGPSCVHTRIDRLGWNCIAKVGTGGADSYVTLFAGSFSSSGVEALKANKHVQYEQSIDMAGKVTLKMDGIVLDHTRGSAAMSLADKNLLALSLWLGGIYYECSQDDPAYTTGLSRIWAT